MTHPDDGKDGKAPETAEIGEDQPAATDGQIQQDAVPVELASGVQSGVNAVLSPEPQSILGKKLSEILKQTADIEVIDRQGQRETLRIKIIDRKRFRGEECQRIMLSCIGEILVQTFTPERAQGDQDIDQLIEKFGDEDHSYADEVLMIINEDTVEGFSLLNYGDPIDHNGQKIPTINWQLTSVEAGKQYAGIGKELYGRIFELYPGTIISFATHAPAVLKSLPTTAEQNGFRFYFLGKRNGDENIPMTDAEQRIGNAAEEEYRKMLREDYEGFLDTIPQNGLPPHTISYGTDSIRWLPEHVWKGRQSPIGDSYMNLRQWIVDRNRTNEGIFGLGVLVPEDVLK